MSRLSTERGRHSATASRSVSPPASRCSVILSLELPERAAGSTTSFGTDRQMNKAD